MVFSVGWEGDIETHKNASELFPSEKEIDGFSFGESGT